MTQMREVCILRYVQCQRGAVFGLRAVGNGVSRLLPSMRRKAAGRDAALLPHLRSEADSGRYGQKGGDAMTEYDLRTRRALRQVTLLEFGFGPETMRRCKLCAECGRANPAQDTHCADCGAVLPEKTL